MSRGADRETTALLIVVAVAVGEVAARNRRHRAEGVSVRTDLAGISAVIAMLSDDTAAPMVVDAVRIELTTLLQLDSCRFDPSARQRRAPYLDRTGAVSYNRFSLPVEAGGRVIGRFVLRGPALGVPTSSDRLLTAVVLADLAGVALRRDDRSGTTLR
jgi:hypothetical protein